MRRFLTVGPPLVALLAVVVTLLAAPAAIRNMQVAQISARVTQAQHRLDQGSLLDQLDAEIEAIAEARAHGDLSENAEYHAAKEAQGHNEGRFMELEDQLSRAEVIDVSKLSGVQIKFGATVTLIDEDTDEKKQ